MEKWKPHPTKENIFFNQDDGLMYRKTEVGSFQMISQKMTELQELEAYRKADGVAAMTSRSRSKVAPPVDSATGGSHT